MSLTSRAYGERGRRRAAKQGIDPARLPPGQSDPLAFRALRRRARGVSQP